MKLIEANVHALAGGDRVELRGFGILEVKETKARTGRNPGTGDTIPIAASRRAPFRPSKELKERLNGKRVVYANEFYMPEAREPIPGSERKPVHSLAQPGPDVFVSAVLR